MSVNQDRLSLLQGRLGITHNNQNSSIQLPTSITSNNNNNFQSGISSQVINISDDEMNQSSQQSNSNNNNNNLNQNNYNNNNNNNNNNFNQNQQIHNSSNNNSSSNNSNNNGNNKNNDNNGNNWLKENSLETSNSKNKLSESDEPVQRTPVKRQRIDKTDSVEIIENNNSRGAQVTSNVEGMRKIESYFSPNIDHTAGHVPRNFTNTRTHSQDAVKDLNNSSSYSNTITTTSSTSSSFSSTSVSSLTTNSQLLSQTTLNSREEKGILSSLTELRKQNENLRIGKEQADQKILRIETELKNANERQRQLEERCSNLCNALEEIHRILAQQEGRRKRDRLAADCVRLGKITTMRSGSGIVEVWEEGYALKELNRKKIELNERKEELERRKNRLKNLKKKYTAASKKGQYGDLMLSVDDETDHGMTLISTAGVDLEIVTEDLAIKMHENIWKNDDKALEEELKMLEAEKAAHMKELRRTQSEDHSRFVRDLPCLGKRYLLQSMLGRGGFSEVWKALDLVELKEVAVKVHQLNPSWSESRKHSYIKHVTREYTIHRELNHSRVVRLYDVFEIDVNSFATVLELCRGTDLDEKLKTLKQIPEKDAKTIIMQILSGLRYLNSPIPNTTTSITDENVTENGNMLPPNAPPSTRKRGIIHFDLKPANILFDSMGDVKITDFGLSKILDEKDEGQTSVELTSQGAGTYWYLPPECFCSADDLPPRISSKVDVWSLGVIFYQMLFGKRPFGEGKSQERVLSEGIMLHATQVEFPTEQAKSTPLQSTTNNSSSSSSSSGVLITTNIPKVSDEAKDFIRTCLTWDQKLRPDVLSLCQHPYIRGNPKKGKNDSI